MPDLRPSTRRAEAARDERLIGGPGGAPYDVSRLTVSFWKGERGGNDRLPSLGWEFAASRELEASDVVSLYSKRRAAVKVIKTALF